MNRYDRYIRILSGVVGVLAAIYGAALLFDPETVNARNASFTWLEKKQADQADRIELSGAEGAVTLVRKEGVWFSSRNNTEYPAKQMRINDFLNILTAKGRYPVRGTSAASFERFGLAEGKASRAVIRGGLSEHPLLDLLIGGTDGAGREIYLRSSGGTEVRSGEDKISAYIDGSPTAWFDLRLFPESLQAESVQRLTVYAPPSEEEPAPAPLVFARQDGGWTVTGVPEADTQRVESYIRSILEAEGADFLEDTRIGDRAGSLLLELGNGQTRAVRIGSLTESNQRNAEVEGSSFKYVLAEWTVNRLFRNGSYFARQ
ncbi:MAG: DUF4340 domain-containing protein [Spirochaetaceae bacterium]|jgi:hypothetical protein|nr:DUF4340 domain-containing protein [Spirochaetaceae bacterium]